MVSDFIEGSTEEQITEMYEKSCDGGFANACNTMHYRILRALEKKYDGNDDALTREEYDFALSYLIKACDFESVSACYSLGKIFSTEFKDIREVDTARSISYFDQACDLGDGSSCGELASLYNGNSEISSDPAKEYKYRLKSCELGYSSQCYFVGIHLKKGEGVAENIQLGLSYQEKGCELGSQDSCYQLAENYRDGEYVDKDVYKAIEYFTLACVKNTSGRCDETRDYIHRVENNIPSEEEKLRSSINTEITASIVASVFCGQDHNQEQLDQSSLYPDINCDSSYGEQPSAKVMFSVEGEEFVSLNFDSIQVDTIKVNGNSALRDNQKRINFGLARASSRAANDENKLNWGVSIYKGVSSPNDVITLQGSITANISSSLMEVVSEPFTLPNFDSFQLGPVLIRGNEFTKLRPALDHVSKQVKGISVNEIDILEKLIETDVLDIDGYIPSYLEELIYQQDLSDKQKYLVSELMYAYQKLEGRRYQYSSGSEDGEWFQFFVAEGSKKIKKVILLDGEKEIGVEDGKGLLITKESDHDYYSFHYLNYYFEDLTSREVKLKIIYWDKPELVKVNFSL